MLNLISQCDHRCIACPLLFCVDWDAEYKCECTANRDLKIDNAEVAPDNCPLKNQHIVIALIGGKISIFEKTGSIQGEWRNRQARET